MTVMTTEPALRDRALEILKHEGNPFRNYFARNPDDDVCAKFHVSDLFSLQRAQLLGAVELYRAQPTLHSELIPILGNKGAGKTHLLYSIKHGTEAGWQMLVTPGTFQKGTDFLEYLLFQVIDTLLGGGKQKGRRPLEVLSVELGRRLFLRSLNASTREEQLDLFPAPGLVRWTRALGLGAGQAAEKTQWLIDNLSRSSFDNHGFAQMRKLCAETNLEGEKACEMIWKHLDRTEPHNTAGLMRRHLYHGFARAAILGDEGELASFLTYGFAEIDYKVKPSRQDLVLALFRVLMEVFQSLKVPLVIAFDQLEDLLLARREDDGHRTAEAFFAGIVQTMHQVDGICFLVFAERGLWNRFVPSLDGYIQDRLNNPIHLPGHGTVKSLRLEAPPVDLVKRVVEARIRPSLVGLADRAELSPFFPFSEEQVTQMAATEPTLRDMLQQYRLLFDHLVFGEAERASYETEAVTVPAVPSRLPATEDETPIRVKSVVIVETPAEESSEEVPTLQPAAPSTGLPDIWNFEIEAARAKLEPEGSLTGATRELQAGLGHFLKTCHEHGVKVGPWRLQHVVPEWPFGDHPTYGVITIAHWVCKDGQPWKVGIGLFLGRGPGKPKDLEIKLAALEATPTVIDHLILLRPDDDLALTGKSKAVWQDAQRRGLHARLEPVAAKDFAVLYGFPRWMTAVGESLPAGSPFPNMAEHLQQRCEKLLEQVCMPISQ